MKEPARPYTGPAFVPGADLATVEHYRAQAKALFGDTRLPAVNYKGRLYPARDL